MTNRTERGGNSAFPWADQGYGHDGMTIREYVATAAMQGTLSAITGTILTDTQKEVIAKQSVSMADHLLAELGKE